MARIHTAMPEGEGHFGERRFAGLLGDLCGEQFDMWFGLDYLPGVSDLDLLVCSRDLGFFVVEVKAVNLSAILSCSATHMEIKNRHADRHPLKQARRAQIGLIEYLKSVKIYPPFFYTTAALPDIRRSEFIGRFGSVPAIVMQAEGMLFAEDLVSEEALVQRLAHILKHPPYGAAPQYVRPPEALVVRKLLDAMSFEGKPPPSAGDIERSKTLKEKVPRNSMLANYVQPGTREPVVFRGYPGTGKTYLLLRIALEHARAGRSVLFACFNKVLASDIRRMLATTAFPKDVVSRIDITHVWALRARYSSDYVPGDEAVLREIDTIKLNQSPLETYGTICIDEAQDLPEWSFHLIAWHAKAEAEWFFAHGPGQEMYSDDPAPYLSQLLEDAAVAKHVEQLKRVYRTAQIDFLVAQGVFEHAPDVGKIRRWANDRPLPVLPQDGEEADQGALFDTALDVAFEASGQLPTIVEIPEWDPDLAPNDATLRRRALTEVVTNELSLAAAEGRPGDVAVLLRNVSDHRDADDVRAVLAGLSVPFTDQIEPANRDLMLPAGHVRLVSFKSARGIEAHRTVLVGFDDLAGATGPAYRDSRNQAYVALSRSRASTTVISRPHRRNEFSSFLVALVAEYAKRADLSADSGNFPQPTVPTAAWSPGTVDRVVEERGFGFIKGESGDEVFFHVSSLLGIDLADSVGRGVVFTSVVVDRGLQATIVALDPPSGHEFVPQPGCVPGYVTTPAGDRGFGFLLTPGLTKHVFFHVNQVANSRPLTMGGRVDVMLDEGDPEKPRAMLVAPRD